MKEVKKELTISLSGAPTEDSINAENKAGTSNPQTGEEKHLAAGDSRDKNAEFEALIENEYKDEFSKKVQKIVKNRLKEVKAMKETNEKNAQIVSYLMEKLGIKDGDTDKIERMIDSQMTSEEKNKEKEMSQEKTQQLIKKLIQENTYLKKSFDEQIRNIQMRARVEAWRNQAEQAKKAYGDFDFEKELKNPEFVRLIKAGVDVKNAYEVVNLTNILDNNSKNAEKKVVDSIRSKGNRPVENGSDSSGGIILSSNVSKLTKKQRAELAKRAAKGERIEF